jgi:predicted dehydrogenase
MENRLNRREFMAAAAVAAAGSAATMGAVSAAPRRTGRRRADTISIGLIGCGGRGTGAAYNALEADADTRITAMADLFADRLGSSREHLAGEAAFAGRGVVDDSRCYTGFDAYRQLLAEADVDVVILATPPHFRSIHFEAAVNAGKHVFMEKPAASDPAGVRRAIAAAKAADEAGLCIVAGTQRRHEASYLAAMEQIKSGAIGDVTHASCYWNQGGLWVHERKPDYSDMEWQVRNWLYFAWLSGDHIVEQHVHNLDVVNWAMGATPVRCLGIGGRQVRTEPKYGNIFDHFSIEYEYPDGRSALSMCRQIDGCAGRVEEHIFGTKGRLLTRPGFAEIAGASQWRFGEDNPNPYVVEHQDLIAAIRSGSRINEAKRVAESTLTAIMGRMSAYTGQEVTWEQAMNSKLDLAPPAYAFGEVPVRPVPVPGHTPLE